MNTNDKRNGSYVEYAVEDEDGEVTAVSSERIADSYAYFSARFTKKSRTVTISDWK